MREKRTIVGGVPARVYDPGGAVACCSSDMAVVTARTANGSFGCRAATRIGRGSLWRASTRVRRLYESVAAKSKRLQFFPGGHDEWGPELIEASVSFLTEHVAPATSPMRRP